MTMTRPKLSLVAQFDDLQRNSRVLTQGIETEFERFVRFQEEWRKRLAISHEEKEEMMARIRHLENSNISLETKLKNARAQIEHELKKRRAAEADRNELEGHIGRVREVINEKDNQGILDEKDRQRLEFINSDYHISHNYESPRKNLSMIEESHSLLSDADISYDKTEEDLDAGDRSYLRSGREWKRSYDNHMDQEGASPHATETRTPEKKKRRSSRKRHRRSRSANAVVTAHLTLHKDGVDASAEIDADGSRKRVHSSSPADSRRTLRKCNSADPVHSAVLSPIEEFGSGYNYNQSPRKILERLNKQVTPPSSSTLRRHNSGNNLYRPHTFLARTQLRPGGETCIPCGKRIAFGTKAYKCKECSMMSHEACKEDAPLPCIACHITPNRNVKNLLAEYAPQDSPCIPAIVIHCINEVELRGLTEQGIYRVPGSEKEVRDLKEKFFKGKGIPSLSAVLDINVICGCLKSFLKELKESTVTFDLWKSFVAATQLPDREEAYSAIYQAVSELPRANRDTLAYVILHLQKVAESPDTLMTRSNLSKVFGPTLVGYSCPNPQNEQMLKETICGQKVVELLMSISPDYWTNFINVEHEVSVFPNHAVTESPYTPNPDKPVYESMLGPLGTPTSYSESKRGWLTTPRSARSRGASATVIKNFFDSPV